jgi:hypothetical protein
VSDAELRNAAIELAAGVVSELELAGIVIHWCDGVLSVSGG